MHAGDLDHHDEAHVNFDDIQNQERKRFKHLVRQYEQEMNEVKRNMNESKKRNKIDLLEIFCGPASQLTHQCQQQGYRAQRLGKSQCDLQQVSGRRLLFQTLLEQEPRHAWYSPTCGPWSGWSSLNASKCLQAWDEIKHQRYEHLSQVALGIVVLRHQIRHGRRMRWEQPLNSQMIRLPYLQELHHATLSVVFDMCIAGDLKDPINYKAIRKPMIVMTTSQKLVKMPWKP